MAIKRGWIHDELSFTTHFILVCREQRMTGHLGNNEKYSLFLDSL
jgi:hypothetical protein